MTKRTIREWVEDLDRLSRAAYISLVVVATIALTVLFVLVLRDNRRISDQQDKLEAQAKRLVAQEKITHRALVYNCQTNNVVRALADETVTLLKSRPPTIPNQTAVLIFSRYVEILNDDRACREVLQRNP